MEPTPLGRLAKHLAGIEAGYFGHVFGRPFDVELDWYGEDAEPRRVGTSGTPTSCAS